MTSTTLKDIADAVGMSQMTVSRALRGVGRVNEATRKRVRQAATELGYTDKHHGLLAPPRHWGKTEPGLKLLVVTGPHLSGDDELSRELLRGMEARLSMNAGSVEFISDHSLEGILAAWDAQKASGLVLRSELPGSWLTELAKRGPVIYGASYDFHRGIDAVYSNELRSAAMVYEYLSTHGHRHILWLGLEDRNVPLWVPTQQFEKAHGIDRSAVSIHGPRYAAWTYLAGTVNVPGLARVVMFERNWQRDSLTEAVTRGLDKLGTLDPAPTAIVIPTDYMGVTLLDVLRERGIQVPRDMSMICYGGTAISRQSTPQLTAVKLPMYTIGRAIPELIERRLADPSAVAMSLQFEAQLVEGESVACQKNKP